MAQKRQCEFFLLRYVPDAIKDEFVNVGVVLVERESGFAEARFAQNWSRVRCLDPGVDAEMLESLEIDLRKRLQSKVADREALVKLLGDTFSNTLQLSGTKAVLAESPQQEIEELAKTYLEPVRRGSRKVAGGRREIFRKMRTAFEDAGVWELMQTRIAASEYGAAGDPLKIDCGYKPNGTVRMFHSVALEGDADAVKALAYSYPLIAKGIAEKLGATAQLTAIVERADDRDEESLFAMATMRQSDIRVAALSEMGVLAERAQRELGIA